MTAAPFVLLLCTVGASPAFGPDPAPAGAPDVDFYPWRADVGRFAGEVAALEERDRRLYEAGGPGAGAVLLAGSSSVRLWMARGGAAPAISRPVAARGYGGARFSDFAWYADRLFAPHLTPGAPGANVAAIALFVGNDITGGAEAEPGAQTAAGAAAFVRHTLATARALDADVPVLLIAVTPTPARFAAWPRIRAFNGEMQRIAEGTDGVYYLDAAPAYLNADGSPKAELFGADRLHQNAAGYEVWASLIDARLTEILGPAE